VFWNFLLSFTDKYVLVYFSETQFVAVVVCLYVLYMSALCCSEGTALRTCRALAVQRWTTLKVISEGHSAAQTPA
jgi:hypothetical protein